VCRYAECHYAECRYAECSFAECRYVSVVMMSVAMMSVVAPRQVMLKKYFLLCQMFESEDSQYSTVDLPRNDETRMKFLFEDERSSLFLPEHQKRIKSFVRFFTGGFSFKL
jgi:hypothetical protein